MTTSDFQVFPELAMYDQCLTDIGLALATYPAEFPLPMKMGSTIGTPPDQEFIVVAIDWNNMVTHGHCIAHYDTAFHITCYAQTSLRVVKMREAVIRGMAGRLNVGREVTVNDGIITAAKKYWLTQYRVARHTAAIRPFTIQGELREIAPITLTAFVTER